MTARSNVLVVDADPAFRAEMEESLNAEGYRVQLAGDVPTAARLLQSQPFDALVADLRSPDGGAVELLAVAARRPEPPVVLVTAEYPETREVVETVRRGALDVLEKPVYPERVATLLGPALEDRRVRLNRKGPERGRPDALVRPPIVGRSEAVVRLLDQVSRVAATPGTTVLVHGESGTGKELVARAIHFDGARRDRPFMAINCAALNESILEAELFGYERGAFTGAAVGGKKGLFESADGGTVFLDEIGEMSPGLQAKLLRVLQDNSFKRVGGVQDIAVDVRVIAATNRDLRDEVAAGRFRKDLFFRLNVMPIRVPALSERLDDLPELASHFLQRFAATMRKPIQGLSAEALARLAAYPWPGNIRELRNVCEYAVIVCDGSLVEPRHLALAESAAAVPESSATPEPGRSGPSLPVKDWTIRSMEEELIRMVLTETRFNIARAARELGINRSTLYNKMKDYGLARAGIAELRQTV